MGTGQTVHVTVGYVVAKHGGLLFLPPLTAETAGVLPHPGASHISRYVTRRAARSGTPCGPARHARRPQPCRHACPAAAWPARALLARRAGLHAIECNYGLDRALSHSAEEATTPMSPPSGLAPCCQWTARQSVRLLRFGLRRLCTPRQAECIAHESVRLLRHSQRTAVVLRPQAQQKRYRLLGPGIRLGVVGCLPAEA